MSMRRKDLRRFHSFRYQSLNTPCRPNALSALIISGQSPCIVFPDRAICASEVLKEAMPKIKNFPKNHFRPGTIRMGGED